MRKLHTVLLAAALALTVQATARAVTFTATLGSIKITARPGQVLTREFRLTLDADQPKTRFNSHMQDWWRNEDGTQSFYRDPGTLAHSCGRWVTLNPVEVEVPPGGTLITRLTVTVSPEAKPGGYWCVLTVDELADPLATSEGVGIRFMASVSIGVFVYVGEQQRAAEITAVEILNDAAVVRLRNIGNTPLAIEGRFEFAGESFAGFETRVREALLDLPSQGHIAVVTSATPIALSAGATLDLTPNRVMQLAGAQRNTAFSEIDFRRGDPRLISFNNIPHIRGHLITTR